MKFSEKFERYLAIRELEFADKERDGFLRRAPAANPPHLMRPVRVLVLRPFCINGKAICIDNVVELPFFDARSLAALKKCEIIE